MILKKLYIKMLNFFFCFIKIIDNEWVKLIKIRSREFYNLCVEKIQFYRKICVLIIECNK